MQEIKFGPSGNQQDFFDKGYKKSEESAKYVKELGLNAFEYSFGRGINLSEQKALSIGSAFRENEIEISVHAPYYINFANPDDEMANKSFSYVIESAKMLKLLGGKRLVFHPATQGKMEREEAVKLTLKRLATLAEKIYASGLEDLLFCPETMGKLAQIGTIEEVLEMCKIDKVFVPAIDFGHVNAREQGSLKTETDYLLRLKKVEAEIGREKLDKLHIHFSKIEYTKKGEVRHLTFEDKIYGPEFSPLAKALKTMGVKPYIICESNGTQAFDAVTMKNIYESVN